MAVHQTYLTTGEFERWRVEESEYRNGIKADVKEILGLVRQQNGRVGTLEKSFAIIEREIEAVKSADLAMDIAVQKILKDGCHQYENHKDTMEVLEGAGVLPNTDGAPPPRQGFSIPALNTRQKAVVGVGATALLLPAITDLIALGKAVITWLTTIHTAVR